MIHVLESQQTIDAKLRSFRLQITPQEPGTWESIDAFTPSSRSFILLAVSILALESRPQDPQSTEAVSQRNRASFVARFH